MTFYNYINIYLFASLKLKQIHTKKLFMLKVSISYE